jgi:hypothetical protein
MQWNARHASEVEGAAQIVRGEPTRRMKVCLVCVEIFAWGKYGGFGRSARMIGRELVKRGVEVSAVVPRRSGQGPVEELDGMTVYSFPMSRPWAARELFRRCDADIYHSQHPSYSTALALDAQLPSLFPLLRV